MLDELKKKIMKQGADDLVLCQVKSDSHQIKFVNNKIVTNQSYFYDSVSIFMVKDKKVITTSVNNMNDVDRIVKKLFDYIKIIKPKEDYGGIYSSKLSSYKKLQETYDPKILDLDKVDMVEKGINAALESGAKRSSGVLESSSAQARLVTSAGVDVEDKGTDVYYSIRAFTGRDASGGKVCCSRMLNKFELEDTSKEAAGISVLAKNPVIIEPGKYDIIFDPLPIANLLNPLVESTSAFSVDSGISCFVDKLGQKVFNDKVTIYDNPLLTNGLGARRFDDEGRPTQKTTIFDKGVLKTYLHNTSTAKKYGVESTGNAGLIDPSPNCIEVEAGDEKEFSDGLRITNLWYTRFQNYNTADFSTIPRDGIFLMKDGEIVKSVKNIRISDNMLKMMQNVQGLSQSRKQIYGWEADIPVLTPTFFIKDLNVTLGQE